MSKYLNLKGTKFYRWNIIGNPEKKGNYTVYECVCDCGTTKKVYAHMLVENKHSMSKSCGCYQKEVAKKTMTTHGHNSNGVISSEYKSWYSMIQRTTNPKNHEYKNYGGKGLTVCEEWRKFDNFIKDMGNKPTIDHSIDRIDNDKGYCKENCKWSTRFEQAQNKSVTKRNTNGGYVGVTLNKPNGKYYSRIRVNNKVIRIGTYKTIEEAFEARLKAEEQYFGRIISKTPQV